jgi:GTPase SAR1 family protein
MRNLGATTIADGKDALARLIHDIGQHRLDWNEAETRFQIIDRIIVECLGWPRELVRLEQAQGRAYADYELGQPRRAIWEAKRERRTFELPANPDLKLVSDLRSIIELGGEAADAVRQVQGYCSARGVEIAVASNGPQLIAFLATRTDGTAPLEGRCLLIDGYEHLQSAFPLVWQTLSPAGVAERRLNRLLNVGDDRALPPKLSTFLHNYPRYRYPSDLQNTLRAVAELLLIDVVDQLEVERQFYEQCYCESGALSQHALISRQLLAARYTSLFDPREPAPTVSPVAEGRGRPALTPEIMAEAISQRPIVLIGDVGVGKTAFLKHLMYVSAFEEFQNALYIYIDLGSQGALTANLQDFVLSEIETQLRTKHGVDVHEAPFVQGVYHGEVLRFQRGIYGSLRETNRPLYEQKLIEFLDEKIRRRDRHLKEAIHHIASGRQQQVIIVLDNADQRSYEIQQDAFIIAQNLARDWRAAVFISVRPQTFYLSKQSGALTAYPHRVFTILPPRVDHVIERRITFALNMAEGRIHVEMLRDIGLRLGNLALFLKALLYSLAKNEELVEFLSNITGGNIRAVIDLVTRFIGSANVDSQKIIDIMEREGSYIVPVHEFWKAALLGEFSYYHPPSSLALNLFDISSANPNEHFLLPMLIAYLISDGRHKSKEGFVASESIVSEMQGWGFIPAISEAALRRANNKKLIETSQRVTFDEDEAGLHGDMPDEFRVSTIGAYHLKRWIGEFAYLDAVSLDTPILDADIREAIRPHIESFAIGDRLERAIAFHRYLSEAWHNSNLRPPYFDWVLAIAPGEESFQRVRRAIERTERERSRPAQ